LIYAASNRSDQPGDQPLEKVAMTVSRRIAFSAAALVASVSASHAGPCAADIDRMQARVDARLEGIAAAGPSGRESVAATMNRQPTPGSIAAAEERLGDLPPQAMAAVQQSMTRARAADDANDKAACEQALADVQRALGP
jgi:hypothetical protein